MITTEVLDQWLTEIAGRIQAGQLRRIGETLWFFDLDDYTHLELRRDDDGKKLVLITDIGTPVIGEEQSTYEALLLINGLWEKTGGVRMALRRPGGAVDLIFDLPLDGLEQDSLLSWIERFITAANQWRAIIPARSLDRTDEPSPLESLEMIRI